MMDFLLIHYKAIIAIIGSLTGLLALSITFYSKYRDSNIKDKELELKKVQFDLEKKHQITKEKHQQLFEQKIDLYNELHSLSLEHKKNLLDVGREDYELDGNGRDSYFVITEEDIFLKTFISIKTTMDNNIFVVSEDLEALFTKMLLDYEKNESVFKHIMSVGAYGDNEDLKKEDEKMKDEFCDKHKTTLEHFFEQVKIEITNLRKII